MEVNSLMRILQVKIALLSIKSGIPKPFDLSPNIKIHNLKRDQMNGPKFSMHIFWMPIFISLTGEQNLSLVKKCNLQK